MPHFFHQRLVPVIFSLALLVFILTVLATWKEYRELIQADDWVMHTHKVIETTLALNGRIEHAESGERGYLLTGQKAYLASYQHALAQINQDLLLLKSLTRDNPEQQRRLQTLQALLTRRRASVDALLRMRIGSVASIRLFERQHSFVQMQALRQMTDVIAATERQLLQQRNHLLLGQSNRTAAMLALGYLLSGGLTFFGLYLYRQQTKRRSEAEHARFESDRRFSLMVNAAEDYAFLMLDPSGEVISWNPGAERIYGYTAGDIIGSNLNRFYPPGNGPRQQGMELATAATLGTYREEGWRMRKDGKSFWANITIIALRDAAGILQGFAKITRDMTERKRYEERLHDLNAKLEARAAERAEQWRVTFEQGPLPVARFDLAGNFLEANPRFCQMTGYSEAELCKLNAADLSPADEMADAAEHVQMLLSGQSESYSREKTFIRKDGGIVLAQATVTIVRDKTGQSLYLIGACIDITARKLAEKALQEAEENLRLIVDGARDYAMMMLEPNGMVTTWNSGAERIVGYAPQDIIGRHYSILFTPEDIQADTPAAELEIARRQGQSMDDRWQLRRDGSRYFASGRTMALVTSDARVRGFVKIFSDMTDRRLAEERNFYLANHDSLTGLPNRSYFSSRLHEALAQASRSGHHVALLLLDLDRFKYVNDTLGHHVGDLLLKEVAKRLLTCVRATDTVARLGGDEFVVIQTRLEQPDTGNVLASKIVHELSRPYQLDGHDIHSGASVGVTLYPRDATDPVELMKTADLAMYKAKALGRANFQFYSDDLQALAQSRKQLETELRQALTQHQFFLLYQPQIDLKTWQMTGVEALLRWNYPGQPMVSPAVFIALAEETGLIVPIGEWVMRTACQQAHIWQQSGLPPFTTAINLSARQFKDPDFRALIRQILNETGLDPAALEIEITEGLLLESNPENDSLLSELKEMGVKVAVDDFGTGFSALSYLKHFPVDVLKIDRSFTHNLPHNRHDAAIASSIISLAAKLDIEVVAEGVETAEQLAYLAAQQCTTAQGFFFGPPMTAEALEAQLLSGTWSQINPPLQAN